MGGPPPHSGLAGSLSLPYRPSGVCLLDQGQQRGGAAGGQDRPAAGAPGLPHGWAACGGLEPDSPLAGQQLVEARRLVQVWGMGAGCQIGGCLGVQLSGQPPETGVIPPRVVMTRHQNCPPPSLGGGGPSQGSMIWGAASHASGAGRGYSGSCWPSTAARMSWLDTGNLSLTSWARSPSQSAAAQASSRLPATRCSRRPAAILSARSAMARRSWGVTPSWSALTIASAWARASAWSRAATASSWCPLPGAWGTCPDTWAWHTGQVSVTTRRGRGPD